MAPQVSVKQPQTTFRPDISYLITGAAGGFGQVRQTPKLWQATELGGYDEQGLSSHTPD